MLIALFGACVLRDILPLFSWLFLTLFKLPKRKTMQFSFQFHQKFTESNQNVCAIFLNREITLELFLCYGSFLMRVATLIKLHLADTLSTLLLIAKIIKGFFLSCPNQKTKGTSPMNMCEYFFFLCSSKIKRKFMIKLTAGC